MIRSLPDEHFTNALLHKVLKLLPLEATVTEVYVATMNIFLSESYDALEETLTHLNSIKLKIFQGRKLQIFVLKS